MTSGVRKASLMAACMVSCMLFSSSTSVMSPEQIFSRDWLNSRSWSSVSDLVSSYSSWSSSARHSSRSLSCAISRSSCSSRLCFNLLVSVCPREAILSLLWD
uniref:Putative secreted protein n=1 Tax=Ixodes ricinus TaxID=34613 RepID=A0A6B0UIE1_IXORI